MKYLDITLPLPAENLAADEALLDTCEAEAAEGVLRFYEPRESAVVVGYGNRSAVEADLDACAREGVPVLRRVSGGGTVVLGPGCLAYALVLPIGWTTELETVTGTNRYVLDRIKGALEGLIARPIRVQGHTDLTVDDLKFAGNAQRRRSRALLFHGTLLLHSDLECIGRLLRMPSVQPAYRRGRDHAAFLTNLRVPAEVVKTVLRDSWGAKDLWSRPLAPLVETLMKERYGRADWHGRR